MGKPMRKRRIAVKKPRLKTNFILAIFTGIIIGLIATLILRFMAGKFF